MPINLTKWSSCFETQKQRKIVHMYVNGKMMPVETIPGMDGGCKRRMVKGVNSSMIYMMHCKDICKYHNVPPTQQLKKKKER
jgi:hypothetical protein